LDSHFPTGPSKDAEEAASLASLVQHAGFSVLCDLLQRAKTLAENNLRNPTGKAQESIYNYGYNNGCLDQLDVILKLPENLQQQLEEVKRNAK